ncbi:MAG: N-acetylneuraminate synthase family protein [Clostridia bacterium]
MAKYIEIAGRKIGPEENPVVIAEIGLNHNGSLEIAKSMVDAAKEAGIEIIKHQTHIPEQELSPLAKEIKMYNTDTTSLYEKLEKICLSEKDEQELKQYVEDKGMIFISAPFSFAAVDRLEKMNVKAYKISSSQMNNYPLLEYVASTRKPIILSTGMNDIEGVKKAVKTIQKYHDEFALLHCTNIYPTPADKIRLNALKEMKESFPGVVIGLSDHSLNNHSSYAALTLGASIIERHFTDTRKRKGNDIPWSMTPSEAKELVEFANTINKMKAGKKEQLAEEKEIIEKNCFTVVTSRSIRKGSSITKEDLTTKGPNKSGIPAEDLYKVIWKKAVKNLDANYHLQWEDIE